MLSHAIFWLVSVAIVTGSRIPGGDLDSAPRTSGSLENRYNNQNSSRRSNSPAPRYFDEFLQLIAMTGEVPDINPDGSYSFPGQGRSSHVSAGQRNSTNLMSSRRNRRRHHRRPNIQSRIRQALQLERDNGNLAQRTSDSPRPSSLRSRIASALGSGSRRNLADFDRLEAELNGIGTSHWSCCDLGELAGTKGFLCNAQFYSSRLQLNRLSNRVHNRRLRGSYFANGAPTARGEVLITTFNGCMSYYTSANEFQGCCNASRRRREQDESSRLRTNF